MDILGHYGAGPVLTAELVGLLCLLVIVIHALIAELKEMIER